MQNIHTIEIEGHRLQVNGNQVLDPCRRCAGMGVFNEYRKVNGGTCFECHGAEGTWMDIEEARAIYRRRAKDRARREAKRQAKLAQRDAEADAFAATHPELVAHLRTLLDADGAAGAPHILVDMAEKLSRYGSLSDKQVELAEKIRAEQVTRAAERAAEREAAEDAPTGRQVVTGQVIKVASKSNPYSYHAELVWRITVKDDRGFIVNGALPQALRDAQNAADEDLYALGGRRVRFTATLEHGDDAKFAFAKRPAKAELLAEEPVAA